MSETNWSRTSLIEILVYIEQHHFELIEKMQKIQVLLEQVVELRGDNSDSALVSLQEFYTIFKDEMEHHFKKEERMLFPYIRQMDNFDKNLGPKPDFQHSSIKNPISQIEYDHDQIENIMLDKLRTITGNYQLPQDAGEAFEALYADLEDIESNFKEHIDLEHNILFPLVIKLELQLIHKKG